MARGAVSEDVQQQDASIGNTTDKKSYPEPLKLSGSLDHFKHEETTPVIGREYPDLNLVDDILNASNSSERLRDLAITSPSHPSHPPPKPL